MAEALVGTIATKVARALNLEKPNALLARELIREASRAQARLLCYLFLTFQYYFFVCDIPPSHCRHALRRGPSCCFIDDLSASPSSSLALRSLSFLLTIPEGQNGLI